MTKLYVYGAIGILTILMGLGAFWQHGRYVALNEQYKLIVEANKGLAEANEKQRQTSEITNQISTEAAQQISSSLLKTQADVRNLTKAVEKGTQDEKAVMSASLPPDVVRVLDNAIEKRD
jgi:molecular chaperone GrpE (heat shock protein)